MSRVQTVDGRVLAVQRNGATAVHIGDGIVGGYSVHFGPARQLAGALRQGGQARVQTLEGRLLLYSGVRLGDSHWFGGGDAGVIANPQAERVPRGPWVLDDTARQALADALLAACPQEVHDGR